MRVLFFGFLMVGCVLAKPVSLNFQDIPLKDALQTLAEATNLNLVLEDSISGTLTLHLQNVPAEEALETILTLKNLQKQQQGDVLMISPVSESSPTPLQTELITIHYAKVEEIAKTLQTVLPKSVLATDLRTNTLIAQDIPSNIEQIKTLLKQLDQPVPQVLIEARILVMNSDFSQELGARLKINSKHEDFTTNGALTLPIAKAGGALGFTTTLPADIKLDLELSAIEEEGKGEIISRPRLITSNQREAVIESGEEIPYQTQGGKNSRFSTSFKKAVLALRVTPQITTDDHILLRLIVNQDTRGKETSAGPAINTQKIETEVLVKDGETLVLGGVYQHTKNDNLAQVPGLGSLPLIGRLFRNTSGINNKKELLIFVTPKIQSR